MADIQVDELDTQSEAVRDFIDQIPNWIIRWGITVIFLAVVASVYISWLIHYPIIVSAPFRLTTQNAPKPIISRNDSRIVKLFTHDNQYVVAGQTIAYLESTADHSQVLQLLKRLQNLHQLVITNHFEKLDVFPVENFQELGELQGPFENFMQSYIQTLTLFSNGYYLKRKSFLNQELSDLIKTQKQLLEQYTIYLQDESIANKEFEIHKKLYADKVISPLDYQREESKLIAKRLPIKQIEVSISTNSTAQIQKRREITELDKQALEQKKQFEQAINTLISAITDWKKRYLLEAPLSGILHYSTILQENQLLRANSEVMYVGATSKNQYLGDVRIPQANFGRVKSGQKVLVKFQGYPFEEFGAIEGVVGTVSQIPSQDNSYFTAVVELPNGLRTTYSKQLTYKTGMEASAEIITEDLRLIERVFYQLRKAINQR
ncbi:HlyD family secretion protein [Spirosoma aerolatum]|uniref:HlyD family secretion protein n=1 Tax=Spirosoma aerolatum TaxID=1211326 RepID=UPI0009AC1813|nr:HlyD family efflux transporter periplasmic adaptor subunit [Spirosoma aerolatum]